MFPHDREVSDELLKELMGIMTHAGFGEMIACDQDTSNLIRSLDEMTSNGSTSVYSEDELRKLIHFVKQIKVISGKGGYSACMVG